MATWDPGLTSTIAPVSSDLRLRFGDFAEPACRSPLFFKRLEQQPCFVWPVEAGGRRSSAAVTGNFIVLEPLGEPDHDRIRVHRLSRLAVQSLVCFLNNAGKPSQMSASRLSAPVRENELQPLDVEPRFVAVPRQSLAQFQASRRIA